MRGFKTIGFFATAAFAATDCSSVAPWQAQDYNGEGALVVYQGLLYKQAWWAASTDVPYKDGEYKPWIYVDDCLPGTEGGAVGGAVSGSASAGGASGPAENVQTVDCTNAFPWQPIVYPSDNLVAVHHEGNHYQQKWYAGELDEPEVSPSDPDHAPWMYNGPCTAGTDGDGPATGINQIIDCTNITPWIGRKIYSEPNQNVTFSGVVYSNRYYTQAIAPVDASPENGDRPWVQIGKCLTGTEQPTPNTDLPSNLAQMLCTCCHGCADIDSLSPVCKDDVEEGKCYFTDCSKFNTYDEGKCADFKKTGIFANYPGNITAPTAPWPARVYAPYMDAGLYPFLKLSEVSQSTGIKYFVIAFITAATGQTISGCHGGFAGVIPVTVGPYAWNTAEMANDYIYDEVNKLRALGGDISISFGGAMGTELADMEDCQQGDATANLFAAYDEIVDFLKLQQIDFDIEGGAADVINTDKGWRYRFAAVKQLIQKYPDLKVSWTLPILPTGLTESGTAFIDALMASGLPIYRINAMTMDYGEETVCPGDQMGRCERDAITALATQVLQSAKSVGRAETLGFNSEKDVYPFLGTTPMLGKNDLTYETYTLQDARDSLAAWTSGSQPIGFLSNWSLHRDAPCNPPISYVDTKCSGEPSQTSQYEFANIFSSFK